MGVEANLEPVYSKGDDNLRRRIWVTVLLGSALVLFSPVVALASLVKEFEFDGMGASVFMLFASIIPFVYANHLYGTRKRGTISVSGEIEALYQEVLEDGEQGPPIVKVEGKSFVIDQETFDELKRLSEGDHVTVRYFSGIGSNGRWVESICSHRPSPSNAESTQFA